MNPPNKKRTKQIKDILKACHKISRDIELSTEIGWKSKTTVVKSKKQYTRKLKHKEHF